MQTETQPPRIPRIPRSALSKRLTSMIVGTNELFRNPVVSIHDSARYHGVKIKTRTEGNRIRVWRMS